MSRSESKILASVLLLACAAAGVSASDGASGRPTPLELFEQRLLPIFKSPNPSSCVQCHLAAVDLKEYILPSHQATFVSLRDQGLIDLEQPEKSKILDLIKMGEKDLDEGARLIHKETRAAEYEAFAAWIKACCGDPALRKLPRDESIRRAGPSRPDAVIRHARRSRVVDSFARKIWSQRMRCFPCHTPYELDAADPKHERPIQRVRKFEEDFGKEFAERLRIFRETPEETLDYLISSSRNTPPDRLPLVNLKSPRKSLIVLKPTSKLPQNVSGDDEPSYVEPVSHMGGLKMHVDDQSYKAFVSWIEDYARVVGDRYDSVEELPTDNWYSSQHVIMVDGTPEDWPQTVPVQLFVHAWDVEKSSWEAEPIAFTQGTVNPRRRAVGALFLLRPRASEAAAEWDPESLTLTPGRYLIKAYVDSRRRLRDDPAVLLGADDFYGQAEIEARWGKGFREAEKISGGALR